MVLGVDTDIEAESVEEFDAWVDWNIVLATEAGLEGFKMTIVELTALRSKIDSALVEAGWQYHSIEKDPC